jgi:predicted DNA-binding transcriptional regulator AlpA
MDKMDPKNGDEAEFLSAKELASKLGMSLEWIQKSTADRRIEGSHKFGRVWRYRLSDVERALLREQFLLPKPKKKPIGGIGKIKFDPPTIAAHR